MSRLYWLLLSAIRRGGKYLQTMLEFAADFRAGMHTALGSKASVHLQKDCDGFQGAGVVRPGSGAGIHARTRGKDLMAHMVAWLVALGRFPGRKETDLVIDLQASPAADLNGPWTGIVELVRQIEACPGIPMLLRRAADMGLLPEPGMAPPSRMESHTQVLFPDMGSIGAAGAPTRFAADLAASTQCSALADPAPYTASACTVYCDRAELTARMMVCIQSDWVDEKTLYIRQVYETQWDGETLILH